MLAARDGLKKGFAHACCARGSEGWLWGLRSRDRKEASEPPMTIDSGCDRISASG